MSLNILPQKPGNDNTTRRTQGSVKARCPALIRTGDTSARLRFSRRQPVNLWTSAGHLSDAPDAEFDMALAVRG